MAGMNVRDDVLNKIEKPKPSGKDLAYRAVAAVFGGPVDLTAMVMRPFGYDVEKPVLGSEWIGQKMENVGLVSEARDPLQEFMASLLVPGGGIEAVPALAGKGMAMLPAAMGVVKAKGGNWLTGSAEEALRPLTRNVPDALRRISEENITLGMRADDRVTSSDALNSWVEGPLTKYVKTRMASPDDEIRKLADQGVLHVDPEALNINLENFKKYPIGSIEARTPLGQSWEGASDLKVGSIPSKEYPGQVNYTIDEARHLPTDLGFRHLTDELSNALNPESGLPRALQLSPDQMKNLSVEKAVRRVADINKWRANQMAEANKAIAFDEKTAPVFKEYQTVPGHGNGQPNEKGLHWREIKWGGSKSSPEELSSGAARAYDQYVALGYAPDEALVKASKDDTLGHLEKQLKYEGDTMGHCVGGYCDAVLSGESQVYTLRDKAGKPHVTIEVTPTSGTVPITPEMRAERSYLPPRATHFNPDTGEAAYELVPPSTRIKQIKGAKNSAPKDEYVPFIQDFIRSGNFSDVGDLANAQLKRASQTFNETELKTLEKLGAKLTGEEYLTNAEVGALQSLFKKAKDQ